MDNRYMYFDEAFARLKKTLEDRGFLYIAYDFDDTIYPHDYPTDTCDAVAEILKVWRNHAYCILFTHRANISYESVLEAFNYIQKHDIPCDEVNTNIHAFKYVKSDSPKPYFDILLDDKAGLNEAYLLLKDLAQDKGLLK